MLIQMMKNMGPGSSRSRAPSRMIGAMVSLAVQQGIL